MRAPAARLLFLFAISLALPVAARAQESVSALPPPVTRSLYRGHWFAFLAAHLEDDSRAASAALAEMRRAARGVGVRRLSDFSRTAVHEARKAEGLGKFDRAARAYDAAILLDDSNYDAVASKIEFLVRRRAWADAATMLPEAAAVLFATRESRLSILSALAVWTAFALGLAVLASVIILLLRHLPRVIHDIRELALHFVGEKGEVPLILLLLLLPLAFGLGPLWVVFYWAAILYPYTEGRERALITAGLLVFGLLPPFVAALSRENIVQRSPLIAAAVDLEERREDQSAEDGLKQASSVFAEDPDVWFLLGRYAERSGDSERALRAYDRAIEKDPKNYRHFLNRGNVYFQEGDFGTASRDYQIAAQLAPEAPETHYNLSVARGEAYDFAGQAAAMTEAKQLSNRKVTAWSQAPSLQRVVTAPYSVSRARGRVEKWNAQPKSRRLPGHTPPYLAWEVFLSPLTLAAWSALFLGVLIVAYRSRWPTASECARCGAPFCRFCKRYGDPPLYCSDCVRLHLRREDVGIQAHVVQAEQLRRRNRARDQRCRIASLLLPGTHRFFSDTPLLGFLALTLFFFCVAAAWIGERFFDLRNLAPDTGLRWFAMVAGGLALMIWIVSNISAWRESHGS